MTTREQLIAELNTASEVVLTQVMAYLLLIKEHRDDTALETAVLSERALAVDWLRPEEEEAWGDL